MRSERNLRERAKRAVETASAVAATFFPELLVLTVALWGLGLFSAFVAGGIVITLLLNVLYTGTLGRR